MGMLGMLPETVSYYESLIGTYTDNIRNADTKSNIIIIVILFSISTVAGFRAQFPPYVPIYRCFCFRCAPSSYCYSRYILASS